jgi:hypothetical protein
MMFSRCGVAGWRRRWAGDDARCDPLARCLRDLGDIRAEKHRIRTEIAVHPPANAPNAVRQSRVSLPYLCHIPAESRLEPCQWAATEPQLCHRQPDHALRRTPATHLPPIRGTLPPSISTPPTRPRRRPAQPHHPFGERPTSQRASREHRAVQADSPPGPGGPTSPLAAMPLR